MAEPLTRAAPFANETWTLITAQRRPGTQAWLQGPLGPDVSPDFVWVPVVTFLQLTIDLMLATTPPLGYGHLYAFEHYLDGWVGLTDAAGWTPEQLQALKKQGRCGAKNSQR